jgi:spermidine/putrescine-binding protein
MHRTILLLALAALSSLVGCGETLSNPGAPRGHRYATNPASQLAHANVHLATRQAVQGTTLQLLTLSEYISPLVLSNFTHGYRVKIQETHLNNRADFYKALESGIHFDVALVPMYAVEELKEKDLLLSFSDEATPNITALMHGDLAPELRSLYQTNHVEYWLPYLWGTAGLAYHSGKNTESRPSWNMIFSASNHLGDSSVWSPKISLLNSPRLNMGIALIHLKHSPNSTNKEEILAAKELWLKALTNVVAIGETTTMVEQMVTHKSTLAPTWGALLGNKIGEAEVLFGIPSEGTLVFVDGLVISKKCTHVEAALTFVNYLLAPQVAAHTTRWSKFASANKKTRTFLERKIVEGPAYVAPDPNSNPELLHHLPNGVEQLYLDSWAEVVKTFEQNDKETASARTPRRPTEAKLKPVEGFY